MGNNQEDDSVLYLAIGIALILWGFIVTISGHYVVGILMIALSYLPHNHSIKIIRKG